MRRLFYVGKTDGTLPKQGFPTLAQALEALSILAVSDPEGVDRGDYYIDDPEDPRGSGGSGGL